MKLNIKELSVKISANKYLLTFLLGFSLYMLIQLPELIAHNGIVLFRSDYNSQSIPFTYHIYDTIKSGDWGLDFSTGYGSVFMNSYAYYNLYSPFTWLYMIFPRDALIYAIPFITAIKMGIGSMLGFAYIKRFTQKGAFAMVGGLVYMFSTFTAYNLVFHFMDVIALFPLLLISLEELCINKRRGLFAFCVCFMLVLNYYFFIGQVVFTVIYYFIRCLDKENGFKLKSLPSVAIEAIIGVLLSMIVITPLVYMISASDKATTMLEPSEFFIYENLTRYLKILQSMFTLPDCFYFTALFPDSANVYPYGGLGASIALYVPLFSVAGAINYIIHKKKSWDSILLIICGICIFVPVLNSMFSAFNTFYYARWFYMPILIIASVSVKALENSETKIKCGVITCAAANAAMLFYAVFFDEFAPIEKTGRSLYNPFFIYIYIAISLVSLLLYAMITKSKRDKEFIPKLFIFTTLTIYISFGFIYYITVAAVHKKDEVIYECNFGNELSQELELSDGDRVLTAYGAVNMNTVWGYPALAAFNSLYENSVTEFYESIGLKGNTNSIEILKHTEEELAAFSSVKYYYIVGDDISEQFKTAEYIETVHSYSLYKNAAYIPMGFTYDSCISADEFAKLSSIEKKRALIKAIVLENPDDFSGMLSEVNPSEMDLSDEYAFISDAKERVEESSYNFKWGSDGFSCDIDLSLDNLVFFSIARNDGYTAYVDGIQSDIISANVGFMAVEVPAGTHHIEFKYEICGLKQGTVISLFGIAAFTVYTIITRRLSKKAS